MESVEADKMHCLIHTAVVAVKYLVSNTILCQDVVSFKTGCGVKCWLFWARFTVITSVPCLSTADNTVAVGGALFKEVQLSVETNWSWSQPWMTTGWTAVLLEVLLD